MLSPRSRRGASMSIVATQTLSRRAGRCTPTVEMAAAGRYYRGFCSFLRVEPGSLEGVDLLPVALHVYDGPALRVRLVERLVEPADRGLAIVRPLPRCVGVADQPHESGTVAGGPLQHLLVAVGVAEREDRPAPDEAMDADRLSGLVVDMNHLRQLHEDGLPVAHLEFRLPDAADDLLRWDAVHLLGEDPHEVDPAARDNESLEAVGPQVQQQLQHGLVDELAVAALESGMLGLGQPVLHGLGELVGGHARMGHGYHLGYALLPRRGARLPVVLAEPL